MRITAIEDVREFQRRAEPLLAGHEAEYPLLVGLLAELAEKGWQGRYAAPPLLALVEAKERTVGLAMRTPPHALLLTHLPTQALPILARWLRDRQVDPPAVLAPKATADAFAAEWSGLAGKRATRKHALRTHALRRVLLPPLPPGRTRQATEQDIDRLLPWAQDFTRYAGQAPRDEAPIVRRQVASGSVWLWENRQPVAMASAVQPTPHGIRISWVYTPPEHRRRGYATALVAQLSQHLLDNGRQFCFLFTDLANPTANSIYGKIGYEGICDYAEYAFA